MLRHCRWERLRFAVLSSQIKETSKHPSAGKKGIRLLIIDDSPAIRQTLARVGFSLPRVEIVGEAENGIERLKLVRKLRADVVALDLLMLGSWTELS